MGTGKYIKEIDYKKGKATRDEEQKFNIAPAPTNNTKPTPNQSPKHPQAILKIIGFRQGAETRRTMEYIARLDEKQFEEEKLELENQDGIKLNGKEAIENLYNEWSEDFDWPERSVGKNRHATHMILSAKADTNHLNNGRVEQSAREFLHENFGKKGYEYVFVLHTDTDNPHVHVVFKNYNKELKRKLRMDKNDLYYYREAFGNQLSINGLEHISTLKLDEPLEYFDEKINDVKAMLEKYTSKISSSSKTLQLTTQVEKSVIVPGQKDMNAQAENIKNLLERYNSNKLTALQVQTLKKEISQYKFSSLNFEKNPEPFIKLDAIRSHAIAQRDIQTLDKTFELLPDDINIKVEAYAQAFNITNKQIQEKLMIEDYDENYFFPLYMEVEGKELGFEDRIAEKKVELVNDAYQKYNLVEREFKSESDLKNINTSSIKFENEMLEHLNTLTTDKLYNELYNKTINDIENFQFVSVQKTLKQNEFKADDLKILKNHYSSKLDEISSSLEMDDIFEKIQFKSALDQKSSAIDFDLVAHREIKDKIKLESGELKHQPFIKIEELINQFPNANKIRSAKEHINKYFDGDKSINIKEAYSNKELNSLVIAEAQLYNNKSFDPIGGIKALPVIEKDGKSFRRIGTITVAEDKLMQTAQKQSKYLKTLVDKGIISEDKEKGGFSVISQTKLQRYLKSDEHQKGISSFQDKEQMLKRDEYKKTLRMTQPKKIGIEQNRYQSGYNSGLISSSIDNRVEHLMRELNEAKMKGTSRNKFLKELASLQKELKQKQKLNADIQVKSTIEYLKKERVNILKKSHVEYVKNMPFDKKIEHAIKTLNQQMSLATREIKNLNNTLTYVDELNISRTEKSKSRNELEQLRNDFVDGGLKIMDETNQTLKTFVGVQEKRLKEIKVHDPQKHKVEVKAFEKRLDDFKQHVDFRSQQLSKLVTPKELNRFNALSIQQKRTLKKGKSFSLGLGL